MKKNEIEILKCISIGMIIFLCTSCNSSSQKNIQIDCTQSVSFKIERDKLAEDYTGGILELEIKGDISQKDTISFVIEYPDGKIFNVPIVIDSGKVDYSPKIDWYSSKGSLVYKTNRFKKGVIDINYKYY